MNLRQKNKKLKRDLEFTKKRIELLEKANDAFRRDVVAKERFEIDTLKCYHSDIADRHYHPNDYEKYVCETLVHKLARKMSKYVDVKKLTDNSGIYPMDVYEATVRVVKPRRNQYGLRAEIYMIDEFHNPKI